MSRAIELPTPKQPENPSKTDAQSSQLHLVSVMSRKLFCAWIECLNHHNSCAIVLSEKVQPNSDCGQLFILPEDL